MMHAIGQFNGSIASRFPIIAAPSVIASGLERTQCTLMKRLDDMEARLLTLTIVSKKDNFCRILQAEIMLQIGGDK